MIFFLFLISSAVEASKIIGGKPTNITDVPYQLELDWKSQHRCGAAIIGSQFALTAAHCFDGDSQETIILRAGSSNRQKGEIYKIRDYVIHPGYVTWSNGIPDNDIAFIVVDQPFNFSNSIKSISIAASEPSDDEQALVSGWGVTEDGGTEHADVLQSVKVPVVDREECLISYGENITASMICAGKTGQGVCGGDSGGPLVVDGNLVGLVSWGYGCALDLPGVFANVAHFKDWINQQIKQHFM